MSFDPLVEERMAGGVVLPRHPSGDPMIVPRGETEAIRYTRASSMSEFLVKDIFALKQWEECYLAQAMARNPDLAAEAAVQHYSTGPLTGTQPISARQAAKAALLDIIARALERERIHEAANAGTAVHKATEPGSPDDPLSEPMATAVKEYHVLTAGMERVASEVFVANDAVRAAGTFDSAYITPEFPGFIIVGDTKTGKGYHQAEFEIQLATYAYGEVYLGGPTAPGDWVVAGEIPEEVWEHQRIPFADYFGLPVSLDVGYLVHVPLLGKPKPRIVKLDLRRGWRLAQQAAATRDARNELDAIGIGPKVNHNALAIGELQRLWRQIMQDDDTAMHEPGELTLRARELYQRFAHLWPQQYTDEVKRRST